MTNEVLQEKKKSILNICELQVRSMFFSTRFLFIQRQPKMQVFVSVEQCKSFPNLWRMKQLKRPQAIWGPRLRELYINHGRAEKCIQNFGTRLWREDTIYETQTWM